MSLSFSSSHTPRHKNNLQKLQTSIFLKHLTHWVTHPYSGHSLYANPAAAFLYPASSLLCIFPANVLTKPRLLADDSSHHLSFLLTFSCFPPTWPSAIKNSRSSSGKPLDARAVFAARPRQDTRFVRRLLDFFPGSVRRGGHIYTLLHLSQPANTAAASRSWYPLLLSAAAAVTRFTLLQRQSLD